MSYVEDFVHVQRQLLGHNKPVVMQTGWSICANGTAWTGFHAAFKGGEGTELVIGEHSDVEIAFDKEVESLKIEYYVVSDQHFDDVQMLLDTDGLDTDPFAPPARSFYWLTLTGSGYTEFMPGPISTKPYQHELPGPFRRLTISTSQAGTVHIRKLEWTGTCRQ
ncbi:hypothetical protein ACIPZF_06415 [Pseudomonas sp. NPDC089752]|uniref:hypothetical protein n=1 Tax=Pseudomonas sp. NPDC089752 TaxID=3364472 RepID=UPI0037FC9826